MNHTDWAWPDRRLLLEEGEALTWEQVNHETLQEAAAKAAKHVDVDYDQVLEMEAPKETEGRIWLTVLERCREL